VCHGPKGAGDGPLASELLPAPTDLAHGPYRFRSTPFGAPPIENDIMISTATGLSHTAMGAFKSLGGNILEDLKEYEKVLAAAYFANVPEPIPMSPLPTRPVSELVTKGREVYAKAGCGDCHGAAGRGNGAKAVGLKDDRGRPSVATDLTKRWHYKRGSGSPEIFQILTTGLSGTSMVSYADTLSADERWEVAYYLERSARSQPRFSPTVTASTGVKEIPIDPAAAFWDIVPTTIMPLGPQMEQGPHWTQPSVDSVEVKVAARGDDLGILLVWNDRTRNVRNDDAGKVTAVAAALQRYGEWQLPDQIGIQFPEKLDPKGSLPAPYAGDATRTVRRWMWSAERFERGDTRATVERIGGPSAAPEVVADAAPVETNATYVDGQWRVLFRGKRPFKSTALPLALHAWDGGAGESGKWQSFSGWATIDLK
jgi:DMSO reductase family type II enzyme heme b subunit